MFSINKPVLCKKCWDKGYSTQLHGYRIPPDFLGDEERKTKPIIHKNYCDCFFGKVLEWINNEGGHMKRPEKTEHAKQCLYVLEPRYYGKPSEEKFCNCGAVDYNDAIEEYEAWVKWCMEPVLKVFDEYKDGPMTMGGISEVCYQIDKTIKRYRGVNDG